jgi:hypothetical protein
MTASFTEALPDASIAVGTNVSQIYEGIYTYGDGALLGIAGKSAQQSLTFTLEVSRDGTTFYTLQAGSTLANLPVPAVNNAATYIEPLAWPYFRIKASGNASGSPVTFAMSRHMTT